MSAEPFKLCARLVLAAVSKHHIPSLFYSIFPQLIFDNFIHLAGALFIGIAGYYILSRKAHAIGQPYRAAELAPVASASSTGAVSEGAITGEAQ